MYAAILCLCSITSYQLSACRWMTSWMRPSHPPSSCRSRSTFIKRRTVGSWRSCKSFSRSEDRSWRSICWRQKPCRKRYGALLSALLNGVTTYLNAETGEGVKPPPSLVSPGSPCTHPTSLTPSLHHPLPFQKCHHLGILYPSLPNTVKMEHPGQTAASVVC